MAIKIVKATIEKHIPMRTRLLLFMSLDNLSRRLWTLICLNRLAAQPEERRPLSSTSAEAVPGNCFSMISTMIADTAIKIVTVVVNSKITWTDTEVDETANYIDPQVAKVVGLTSLLIVSIDDGGQEIMIA
jgi:hypothetical protein